MRDFMHGTSAKVLLAVVFVMLALMLYTAAQGDVYKRQYLHRSESANPPIAAYKLQESLPQFPQVQNCAAIFLTSYRFTSVSM